MIEIALCLAIIGFALVSILLVLPSGMNTQRDTREETIINQDASMLMEAIRDGARGLDDLTNYVYAITNYWTVYNPNGTVSSSGVNGYTYSTGPQLRFRINKGARIIGLLSTPEFTDGWQVVPPGSTNGVPIPNVYFGGTSNHVVAYVRSFSGLAAEKPPQDNQIMQADTFGYRVVVVNAPVATDTNVFYQHPFWQSGQNYATTDVVFDHYLGDWDYWRPIVSINNSQVHPREATNQWVRVPVYPLELAKNQRELRLYFEWPQLPNGNVGGFRQNFRISIAGQLVQTNDPLSGISPLINMGLYFYEPQYFSSAP